jgi:hypothetical protein
LGSKPKNYFNQKLNFTIMKINNLANNQVEAINDDGSSFFSSYGTNIAKRDKSGNVTLDAKAWNYSATTIKYLAKYLGTDGKTVKQKVADGTYKLENLN